MAANLAQVAFTKGVPLAADAFAKYFPGAVQGAKSYVAKAIGVTPASVNLGVVASKNGGMYAQTVAEALVRHGMPVDSLWSHMPRSVISDAELQAYRATLVSIQANETKESSAAALGAQPVATEMALMLDEKNRSIRFLMRMFGTNDPTEVLNIKVELDHLHAADITNFLLLNPQ